MRLLYRLRRQLQHSSADVREPSLLPVAVKGTSEWVQKRVLGEALAKVRHHQPNLQRRRVAFEPGALVHSVLTATDLHRLQLMVVREAAAATVLIHPAYHLVIL